MQELRVLAARLVLTYDAEVAPSFDSDAFIAGVYNLRSTFFAYPLKAKLVRRVY